MGAPGAALDELIFPEANHNFSRVLTDLKRSNLSITNRLRSVREDAAFVSDVADAFGRPLIANERCGSWYIAPADKAGSAYFKSTDGHTGQWKFSTRRLNLHLLEAIGAHDGCIIVDSTRRGKRMPDALSKTIPIWCCVLNHVLFPEQLHQAGDGGSRSGNSSRLFTPPQVVSESEHAQMEARVPEFVDTLRRLDVDFAALRGQLRKPLRPFWVTQESQLAPTDAIFDDFHPVVCCTSSRRVAGGEMSEGGYIQGAGDDTENWALGLTPPVFWEHADALLSTPEAELPALVVSLVEKHAQAPSGAPPKRIAPSVSVSALPAPSGPPPSTCTVTVVSQTTEPSSWVKSPSVMEVGLGKHKVASRNLRAALPLICSFVREFFQREPQEPRQVVVACETGKDISVGVALALLCWCFDDEGHFGAQASATGINKTVIKVRLGRIMTAFPEANPNRATLQSVNSFLMDWRQ